MKKSLFRSLSLIGILLIVALSNSCFAQDSNSCSAKDSSSCSVKDSVLPVDSALRDTASRIPDPKLPATPGSISQTVPIGSLVQNFIVALLAVLPAIQLVLKKIPTSYSVRIGGYVGKILDLLTFFVKDQSTNGPPHK